MANTKITSRVIADNSVGIDALNVTDGTNGQALVTDGSGGLSFASVGVSGIDSSADATAITIDSSENVLVGTTSASNISNGTNAGIGLIGQLDYIAVARDGGSTAYFNRLTSDGNIVEFRKDGSTVGSIKVGSNQLIIDASASNLVLENSTRVITFSSSAFAGSGSGNDAVIDLGISNRRFKNLYLSGGVYLGGTSAANALDDYEEGTWTPAFYTYSGVTTTSITINLATYTKIGNIVHIHANIDVTLSSLPGQTVTITGLPFAASNASDTGQRAIIALGGDTANTGGNTSKAHFRTNGSQLDGVYFNASHNTALWNYATMDSPTFALHIHGFYTV